MPPVIVNDIDGAIAGCGDSLPEGAEDVLEVEGPADRVTPSAATAWLFRPDQPVTQIDLADLARLTAVRDNFVWVDLSDYSEEDLRAIGDILNLPSASIHTALSRWQRPQLDVAAEGLFVTATVPRIDSGRYRVYAGELDLFVNSTFLVSVHKRPLPFANEAMARARQNPSLLQQDSAYLLYIILDELLEYYEDLTEAVEDEIERMEERALTDTSNEFLSDLLRLKRYGYMLDRLASQHRGVFAAFLRPDFPYAFPDKMEPYFRDLEARLAHLLDDLTAAKDAINSAFDIYVSHVSHRTNHVMKVLTIVSSVLLPATVILGLYGTNFEDVPLYDPSDFIQMLVAILFTSGVALFIFYRKGWI